MGATDLVDSWRAEAARVGNTEVAAVLRRAAAQLEQCLRGEWDHPPGVAAVATIHGLTDVVEIVLGAEGYGVVQFRSAPGTQRRVVGPDGEQLRVPTHFTAPAMSWFAALEHAARLTSERQDPAAGPAGWPRPPRLPPAGGQRSGEAAAAAAVENPTE